MRALVRLSACLLLGSSFLPTAWAALGPLTVHSRQGEALRADIALTAAPDGAQVASAPRAFYRSAGADWLPAQQQAVSMRIERTANGQAVVRLASTKALADPYLSLVVELSAAGQAPEYRYYTVLLPSTAKEPVSSQGAPVEAPDAAPPARPVPDPENLPGTSQAQVQQPAASSPAPMVSVAELDRIARQEYEAAQARSGGKGSPEAKAAVPAGKPAPAASVAADESGWQWSSAVAGAAATLAVLLAAGAGLLWWRQRRNKTEAAPADEQGGGGQVMTARPPEPEPASLPEVPAPAPVVPVAAPVMAEPAILEADLSAASSEAALAEALASAEAMVEAAPHPAEAPAPVAAAAEPTLESYEFHGADDGAAVRSAVPEAASAPAVALDMDAMFEAAAEPVTASAPVEAAAAEEDLLAAMMEDIHPPVEPDLPAVPAAVPAEAEAKEDPAAIDQDSIDDLMAGFSTPAPSVPPAVMEPPPPEPEPPVEEPEPEPEPKAEPSLLEFDFPLEEIQPAPAPLPSDTNGMELDFDNMLDGDPLDTKLALARVYLDMGDGEGAREIVEEVLQTGTEAQQAAARKLLAGTASAAG